MLLLDEVAGVNLCLVREEAVPPPAPPADWTTSLIGPLLMMGMMAMMVGMGQEGGIT